MNSPGGDGKWITIAEYDELLSSNSSQLEEVRELHTKLRLRDETIRDLRFSVTHSQASTAANTSQLADLSQQLEATVAQLEDERKLRLFKEEEHEADLTELRTLRRELDAAIDARDRSEQSNDAAEKANVDLRKQLQLRDDVISQHGDVTAELFACHQAAEEQQSAILQLDRLLAEARSLPAIVPPRDEAVVASATDLDLEDLDALSSEDGSEGNYSPRLLVEQEYLEQPKSEMKDAQVGTDLLAIEMKDEKVGSDLPLDIQDQTVTSEPSQRDLRWNKMAEEANGQSDFILSLRQELSKHNYLSAASEGLDLRKESHAVELMNSFLENHSHDSREALLAKIRSLFEEIEDQRISLTNSQGELVNIMADRAKLTDDIQNALNTIVDMKDAEVKKQLEVLEDKLMTTLQSKIQTEADAHASQAEVQARLDRVLKSLRTINSSFDTDDEDPLEDDDGAGGLNSTDSSTQHWDDKERIIHLQLSKLQTRLRKAQSERAIAADTTASTSTIRAELDEVQQVITDLSMSHSETSTDGSQIRIRNKETTGVEVASQTENIPPVVITSASGDDNHPNLQRQVVTLYRTIDPLRGWLRVYTTLFSFIVNYIRYDQATAPRSLIPVPTIIQPSRDASNVNEHADRSTEGWLEYIEEYIEDLSPSSPSTLKRDPSPPSLLFNLMALLLHCIIYWIVLSALKERNIWLGANDLSRQLMHDVRTPGVHGQPLSFSIYRLAGYGTASIQHWAMTAASNMSYNIDASRIMPG